MKLIRGVLRRFVDANKAISISFDSVLPQKYRTDGHADFRSSFAPKYLRPGLRVYDVGGGKIPYLGAGLKGELGLTVVGLDVDREELERAPEGAYDRVVCSDIESYRGDGEADLIICQAVLEHVRDVGEAFVAFATILKPGGTALVFVPCRNAVFARLNLLIPAGLKKALLFRLFPDNKFGGGFPSFYDRCTPRQFRALAQQHGFDVADERFYFMSGYFTFFFPAFLVWRLWVLLFHAVGGDRASESFSMALTKAPAAGDSLVQRGADAFEGEPAVRAVAGAG